MNTEMAMINDGVHFRVSSGLVKWIYDATTVAYSFYELTSMVGVVRSSFNGEVGSVRLSGNSVTREVNAELLDKDGKHLRTQRWLLRFDTPRRLRLLEH